MRALVRAVLVAGVAALWSGCLTAHYVVTSKDADVRMGGRREGETQVRHVEVFLKKHHFLFGTIPNKPDIDIAQVVGLLPGEALVNLRIDEGYPEGHLPAVYGLAGFVWPVWNPHAVMISGDIVKLAALGAAGAGASSAATGAAGAGAGAGAAGAGAGAAGAGAGAAGAGAGAAGAGAGAGAKGAGAAGAVGAAAAGVDAAGAALSTTAAGTGAATAAAAAPKAAPPTPGRWQHLHGTYTQEDAERGCASVGADLPTRAQLKTGKDLLVRESGDLWTSEREGEDGWIFNAATGATFLKSTGDAYGAYCREKGS